MKEDTDYAWIELKYSIITYLNYAKRQIKRNSSYNPHPLIKALMIAMDGGINIGKGKPGNYQGISGDAEKHSDNIAREQYSVVINLDKEGIITILDITDLILGRKIPLQVIIYLLILTVEFEKIPSNEVEMSIGVDLINKTIPEVNMVLFDNSEWKDAREYFKSELESGKISLPEDIADSFIKGLEAITYNTPWDEYPPQIRSLIGTTWLREKNFNEDKGNIYITALAKTDLKVNFLRHVKEFLFGQSADYFDRYLPFSNIELNKDELLQFGINKEPGRNDPCDCGSGKKYKKCCLNNS